MFNLFIALFGIPYYAYKQIREQSLVGSYEQMTATQQRLRKSFEQSMCISFFEEQKIKEYISSGTNYRKICEEFARDFQAVFGLLWQDRLKIPPLPPVLDPQLYKDEAYSFYLPINHIHWVYRLILASKGKVDHDFLINGYSIGGIQERQMCLKFAKCIEKRLFESGRTDIRLVLEKKEPCNSGAIKIESLCTYPYQRMW